MTYLITRFLGGDPSLRDHDNGPLLSALQIVIAKHPSRTGISVGTNRFFFPYDSRSLDLLLEARKGLSHNWPIEFLYRLIVVQDSIALCVQLFDNCQ